jgi:energy-coupling factor transporter ATP-binding protein EcfA2
MSLLELQRVTKRSTRGARTALVLDDASLSIDAGELVAVWGLRGSGRTTLLRLAAGIDVPDAGAVHFDGRDLAAHGEQLLGREIGYCHSTPRGAASQAAIEEVIVGLLVNGVAPAVARARAHEALARVDGGSLGARRLSELDRAERLRLTIAHALALGPRLLVIDEPVAGVELHQRDAILLLLRSLADDDRLAVLISVGELTGLSGADQAFTLGDGELRGSPKPELAPVVELRPAIGLQASG